MTLKMLDLFSGIGGFSLAAKWAGIETVGFCEIDKYCQKILNKNFPGIPVFPDITKLRGDEVGSVDVIAGGDPCQPHSVAGNRKGTADDRYLWPQMFRVIKTARPTWVVNENVAGSISNGVLDQKIDDLEGIGYVARPFIIPACAAGAPHRRDRVWLVAYRDGEWKLQPERCQQEKRRRSGSGNGIRTPQNANGIGGRRRPQLPSKRLSGGHSVRLRDQVLALALLPTPTSQDHKAGSINQISRGHLRDSITGTLSAEFVRWMMGFPEGWLR